MIQGQNSVVTILAGLLIILCLHFIKDIGKFVFTLFQKKTDGSQHEITKIDLALTQNTQAVRELRIQVQLLERELLEVHKFKADSQKLFSAIKIMAGKDWPRVRKAMEEDALPK